VLPEVLQEHGYRTAAFSANVFFVTHDRLGRGFLHFDDYFFNFTDAVLRTMYGRAFEKYVLQRFGLEDIPARRYAEDINHALMDWVGNSPDRPFFALLNYIDVHDPYLPMEPYRSMFSPAGLLSGRINDRVGRGDPEMDDARLASEIDAYDGGIFYVDEQIRNLVNGLVKKKLMSDTILIITADHGESFGEHGLLLHGHSLYHEQLHVPLMFVWPGHIPENLRIGHPVTNASIAATVLDLIGVKNTLPGAASSLANWSAGDAEHSPVVAHTEKAEWVVERSPAYTGMLGSAFQGQWQLILHELESPQLFNLENDPRQQNNLSGQPDVQALEKSLSRPLNTPSLKSTDRSHGLAANIISPKTG
jgi:arylsulfatase